MTPVIAVRVRNINAVTERDRCIIGSLGQNENKFSFYSSLPIIKSAMENNSIKKHILRFNQGNADSRYSFEALRRGVKKVETRAATSRFRRVNIGDVLVFVCGKNKFEIKINKVSVFKTIDGMLSKYRVKDIMPD